MSRGIDDFATDMGALPVEQQGALLMYMADRATLNRTWITALILVVLYGATVVLLQTLPAATPPPLSPAAYDRLMTLVYTISGLTAFLTVGYVALKTRQVRLMRHVALSVGTPVELLVQIEKLSIRDLRKLVL